MSLLVKLKRIPILIIPYLPSTFAILFYTLFSLVNLKSLPGLHGDEAWSGLKAIDFGSNGIHQLTGMNNYTGILQTLFIRLSFAMAGAGVFQLRIFTVLFNVLGIAVVFFTMHRNNWHKWATYFALSLCSSILLMTSSKIAWEVNTFTLFFISLLFSAGTKIAMSPERLYKKDIYFILAINLLGSYNHIIFSSLGLAAFLSFIFWMNKNRWVKYYLVMHLLVINILNITALIILMRCNINWNAGSILALLSVAIVILYLESHLLSRGWLLVNMSRSCPIFPNKSASKAVWIIAGIAFMIIHGIAFAESISGFKILLQLFSYELPFSLIIMLSICAILFIFFIGYYLWKDLTKPDLQLASAFILIYAGVLCLYTIKTSFRYYLIITILMLLYGTYKASRNRNAEIALSVILFPIMTCYLILQFDISLAKNLPMKAIDFTIGNGQKETSAHFLPKGPVIHFLKEQKIDNVIYNTENSYFISEPIQFYMKIDPYEKKAGNAGVVSYNYHWYSTGFIFYPVN